MTELQIGLIGLGAVAVSGVVVYNTWLEYRHRKLAQELLEPAQDDVLLETSGGETDTLPEPLPWSHDSASSAPEVAPEVSRDDRLAEASVLRHEPQVRGSEGLVRRKEVSLDERVEPALKPVPLVEARIEPVLHVEDEVLAQIDPVMPPIQSDAPPARRVVEPAVPESAPVARAVTPASVAPAKAPAVVPEPPARLSEPAADDYREVAEPQHLLSADIDYIAAFEAIEPTSAAHILSAQQAALTRVRKPIHWFGYNEVTREWETVEADSGVDYRSLRVGLQLVDRRGPVAESDLSVFHVAMHDLAHTLMAIVDMPHRQAVLDTAATLDGFCAGVDIQIGINVVSTATLFPGTKIRALAEAAGMLIEGGRFVRADDDGNVLYVLLNQEDAGFSSESMKTLTTHGLTFLLDVPTVAHGDRVFNQMVDLAKRFADVLKGVLVDDNRRPLPDGALEPIRRQIAQYQSTMAARKLPAGGGLAKRLFS